MKVVSLIALFPLCVFAFAQIGDGEAIARAVTYVRRIDSSVNLGQGRVVRDRVRRRLMVWFAENEVSVTLWEDGAFVSYSCFKADSAPDHNRFRTDDEAWSAAEALISRFDLPEGLERDRIERQKNPMWLVRCHFYPKPHGYPSRGGNCAIVEFLKGDGRPKHVTVSRGWTYEPPNIQITEAEARAKASEIYGGEPTSWRVELQYSVGSSPREPEYMQELARRKIARLVYALWREHETGSEAMVIVDSVTGQVVTHGRFGGMMASRDGQSQPKEPEMQVSNLEPVTTRSPKETPDMSARRTKRSVYVWLFPVVTLAAIFVAAVLASKLRSAAHKRRS